MALYHEYQGVTILLKKVTAKVTAFFRSASQTTLSYLIFIAR